MLEHIVGYLCVRCGDRLPPEAIPAGTCPACGIEGILDVLFDAKRAARTLTLAALESRPSSIARYRELLPVANPASVPLLRVGGAPIIDAPRLAKALGLGEVLVQDEGRGPTASFKDRASAVGVARALEEGKRHAACASTGNAATSLAGACAAAGLPCTIFVPARAPAPKLAQLLVFGARVVRVQGSYDEAYRLCEAACARHGWYNRNCAVNPYLVEGKKTAGLEIGERLGDRMPDWVAVAVGDGCTIAGVGKGLCEMVEVGIATRMPRLLGVQAEGSAAIADAFDRGGELEPGGTDTIADSIAVSHPRNWRKAVAAVRQSGGAYARVSDDEILSALRELARQAGVFGEPAAAAAWAGVRRAVAQGTIAPGERVLVLVTGNGLKDVEGAMRAAQSAPLDVAPDVEALERALAM